MEPVCFADLGQQVDPGQFLEFRQRLLQKLKLCLSDDLLPSMPIACRIQAQRQSRHFEESWLPQVGKLFLYVENYNLMIITSAERISRFLQEREPWQDFDMCIFNEDITWCAALTHNDQMKYVSIAQICQ